MVDLKVGYIAIAPKECNDYLTPNKEYKIIKVYEHGSFEIYNDIKKICYCLQESCNHIERKDWSFKTKSN